MVIILVEFYKTLNSLNEKHFFRKIQNHDEKFYFKFQYINKNIVGEAKYDLQLKNGKNIILDSPFKLIDASWIPLFNLNSCQTIRNSNLELIITIRPNRATIMPIPTLVRGNEKILNEAAFSDFTFIVNGKEFKVHRNILGFVSPVMMKLFTTDMAEKRLQTCNVTEISAEIFEYMLHYIYCGKLPENIELVAMNLYEAAHYYQIEPLMEICIYNMSDRLHAGNAVTLYEWSVCFDIADLKAKSWDLVKR